MSDSKRYKEITLGAETADVGSLSVTPFLDICTVLRASRSGVLYTALTTSDGSLEVAIIADNTAAPATPSGILIEGVYLATLPTYDTGDAAVIHLDSRGRLITREATSDTPTTSSVAASLANVTLLAANVDRLGTAILNDSATATLHLKLGATASLTDFTVKIGPDAYYEVPFNYVGIIDGIWDIASGSARITEVI